MQPTVGRVPSDTPTVEASLAGVPAGPTPASDRGVEVCGDDDRLVLSPFLSDGAGLSVHPGPVLTLPRGVSDHYLGLVLTAALGMASSEEIPDADVTSEMQRALRVRSRKALITRRPRVALQPDRSGNLVVTPLAPTASGRAGPAPDETVVDTEVGIDVLARVVRDALVTAAVAIE